MRARQRWRRVPGDSWLHRSPAWTKLAGVAALSVVVLATRDAQVNVGLLVLIVAVAVSARLPLRELVAPVLRIGLIIVAVFAAHLWLTDWATGLRLSSTIVVCIMAAALLDAHDDGGRADRGVRGPRVAAAVRRPATGNRRPGRRAGGPQPPRLSPTSRGSPWRSARARGLEGSRGAVRTIPLVLGTVK